MLSIIFMLAFLLVALTLYTFALFVGVRWTKSPVPTLVRCILATLVISLTPLAIMKAADLALPAAKSFSDAIALDVAEFGLLLVIVWSIIAQVFRLSPLRAFLAWLPALAANLVMLAIVLLVLRPYLVEAFTIPTHGMSPTIRAPYRLAVCPNCGGPLIATAPDAIPPHQRYVPETAVSGICGTCFQSATLPIERVPPTIHTADRFLVSKIGHPRRWSIAAHVADHGDIYLQRIVALPGETIAIADGVIFINGTPVALPPDLIKSKLPVAGFADGSRIDPKFATAENPLRLAADEYFVLGDNTAHSYDSRYRSPVKASALRGVVNAIYWPPARWRTFP